MNYGLVFAVLLLSGCSVLFIPQWDATEYNDFVDIASESAQGTCSVEQRDRLAKLSTHARYYSEFLPHNELIAEGALKMDETVQELNQNDTPSAVYCKIKLRAINMMARTLAKSVGGKPK
jgi:hypothetical protein